MTRTRTITLYAIPQRVGADGRKLCIGFDCNNPVAKGRRRYCSDACFERMQIASSTSYAAQKVEKRDQGVCADCGIDAAGLAVYWSSLRYHMADPDPWVAAYAQRFADELKAAGFRTGSWNSWWEMDHIVPVAEGGGACGLDGLQTLCRPCHLAKTREQARRKAPARRGRGAQLSLGGEF